MNNRLNADRRRKWSPPPKYRYNSTYVHPGVGFSAWQHNSSALASQKTLSSDSRPLQPFPRRTSKTSALRIPEYLHLPTGLLQHQQHLCPDQASWAYHKASFTRCQCSTLSFFRSRSMDVRGSFRCATMKGPTPASHPPSRYIDWFEGAEGRAKATTASGREHLLTRGDSEVLFIGFRSGRGLHQMITGLRVERNIRTPCVPLSVTL